MEAVMHLLPEYFARICAFEPSLLALSLILCANITFTAIHIWQEWKGPVPLYLVFGAVVGCRLPRWLGFLLFTPGLALLQWFFGVAAYTGWPAGVHGDMRFAVFALGAILGGRISDCIVSHWALYLLRYRPNPGLSSTLLYVAEAVLILTAFPRGLAAEPQSSLHGFFTGILFFVFVLPLMAIAGTLIKPWRRERWIRRRAIPDWVNKELEFSRPRSFSASSGG
jgi:hypothetical protein